MSAPTPLPKKNLGGRPKGSKTRTNLIDVAASLRRQGKDPVKELVILATQGRRLEQVDEKTKEKTIVYVPIAPEEQRKIWVELLSYAAPRPRPREQEPLRPPTSPSSPSEQPPEGSASISQLLSLVKGNDTAPTAPAAPGAASPATTPTGGTPPETPRS